MGPIVRIPTTLQPLLDVVGRELPALLKQLSVGQVLQARVVAQPQPGVLRLQIASTEVLARSQVKLHPGSEVKLEVVKRLPLPQLRVLSDPPPQVQQQQVARAAMVRQLTPPEVREAISQLRAGPLSTREAARVQQFVTILRDSGVAIDRLRPAQLKHAVLQSGLFQEARLLAGTPPETPDTKGRLLQLATQLQVDIERGTERAPTQPRPPPEPGERPAHTPMARVPAADTLLERLVRLAEGSVARIQLQQSAALPVDDSPRQAWQLDLPVHLADHSDDVMLRIERDAQANGGGDRPGWSVHLAFAFETIGELQCKVTLNGAQVATTFWCDNTATLQRLEARLPTLADALAGQGLEVVHLEGVLGAPAEPPMQIPLPDRLLDERA
jgi:hypothetical protein